MKTGECKKHVPFSPPYYCYHGCGSVNHCQCINKDQNRGGKDE